MKGGCYNYLDNRLNLNDKISDIVNNYPNIFNNYESEKTKTFFNCAIENLSGFERMFEIITNKSRETNKRILLVDTMNIYKNNIRLYDYMLTKYNITYNLYWLNYAKKYEGRKFAFLLLLSLAKCNDADIFILTVPDVVSYIKYYEIGNKSFFLITANCYIGFEQCYKSNITGRHNETDDYIIMILYLLLSKIINVNISVLTDDNYAWLKDDTLKSDLYLKRKRIIISEDIGTLYATIRSNYIQKTTVTINKDVVNYVKLNDEQIHMILDVVNINTNLAIASYNKSKYKKQLVNALRNAEDEDGFKKVTYRKTKYKYYKYMTKYLSLLSQKNENN